jgi:predicted dehydrogenase
VAVSRRRPELAEEFARRFGARRWHADWRDLMRDDGIDAVYIATPVSLHAPMAIAAAAAGKHVLCEKPMALDVDECDRMIACAESAGVKLGVAYYRPFYPIVQRVRELLAQGAIGAPVMAQLNSFECFDPPRGHPRSWLLDPATSGGGPMFDFGCHRIELLLDLFGDVAEVGALRGNVLFDRPVEDAAVATMRFAPGPLAVVSVAHAAAEPQDTLDIFGSEGSLHVAKLNGASLRIVRGGAETVEQHAVSPNTHLPLIQQFVDAVLDGGAPRVDGAAGRAVNRVLEAVYPPRDGA